MSGVFMISARAVAEWGLLKTVSRIFPRGRWRKSGKGQEARSRPSQ